MQAELGVARDNGVPTLLAGISEIHLLLLLLPRGCVVHAGVVGRAQLGAEHTHLFHAVSVHEGHSSQRLVLGAVNVGRDRCDSNIGQAVGAFARRWFERVGHYVVVSVDNTNVLKYQAMLLVRACTIVLLLG